MASRADVVGQEQDQKLTPGGDAERLHKQCLQALRSVKALPSAGPFLVPVDWKALKLPMYPKMIKNPMDLGTVETKLSSGRYGTVDDFKADVDLVWSNAQTFNSEGSDIYDLATQLRTEFGDKMQGVGPGALVEGGISGGGGGGGARGGGGGGGAMTGDELAQCKHVIRELRKHKDAVVFLEPVNWKELGIPDYPTIIKRPMDLGTVMKRLEAGQYSSVNAFYSEMDLVWSNAMTYNQDESFIFQIAQNLKSLADKKMKDLLANARPSSDEPQELTFDMKRQLNENSNQLSSKDLYGMVGIVEDSCKKAIDQTNPNEVEIDIDLLDLPTFIKLNRYVEDCIKRAAKKAKQ